MPDNPNIITNPNYGKESGTGRIPNGTTYGTCPECGHPLAVRTNYASMHQFFGCTDYPRCTHTEEITQEARMRIAGQPELDL